MGYETKGNSIKKCVSVSVFFIKWLMVRYFHASLTLRHHRYWNGLNQHKLVTYSRLNYQVEWIPGAHIPGNRIQRSFTQGNKPGESGDQLHEAI